MPAAPGDDEVAQVPNDVRRVAVQVVEAAGDLLRKGFAGDFAVIPKGLDGDVVTDLDHLAERLLIERLRDAFPTHGILSEEAEPVQGSGPWCWLVDPLDGSNNVAIGLPIFGVSLGLLYHDLPVLGIVHDGASGSTWTAVRGGGAWGPGGPIRVRTEPLLTQMNVGWTQGYQVGREDPFTLRLKMRLEASTKRVLRLWASSLMWAALARGKLDAVVVRASAGTDLHAGLLLAREAGAVVRTFDGVEFDERFRGLDEEPDLVAGHRLAVEALQRLVESTAR